MRSKLLIFILFVAVMAGHCFADEENDLNFARDFAATAKMINLPLEATLFSAEASSLMSIELPYSAGDLGNKLKLILEYRSRGGDSWVGKGWELKLGYIAKINKFGINNPGNPYSLVLNGFSSELTSIGEGQYRTKNESNQRIKFDGSIWQVWEKDGSEYKFEALINGMWVLTEVKDLHGLSIIIEYDRPSDEEVYLKEIRYPQGQGLSPYCKISFLSEDRADKLISYYYGSAIQTNRRLKEVQFLADDYPQKKYVFNYTTNGATDRSLLASIVEYGKDGTALPATTFSYQQPAAGAVFSTNKEVLLPDTGDVYTQHIGHDFNIVTTSRGPVNTPFDVAIVDMNRDGYPDFVGCKYIYGMRSREGEEAYKSQWVVYPGTKDGFSSPNQLWLDTNDSYFNAEILDTITTYKESINIGSNAAIADMNADGLPDLVYSRFSGDRNGYHIMVRLNMGNKFSATEIKWLDYFRDPYAYYIDPSGSTPYSMKIGKRAFIIDMNNDGKGDLLYYRFAGWAEGMIGQKIYNWIVRLNTGSGFSTEQKIVLTAAQSHFVYTRSDGRLFNGTIRLGFNGMLIDMNNDGLLDLVYNDYGTEVFFTTYDSMTESAISYNWKVRYNTGEKFSDKEELLLANGSVCFFRSSGPYFGTFRYNGVPLRIGENGTLADLNNDGLPDLVFNVYRTERDETRTSSIDWKVIYNRGNTFQGGKEVELLRDMDYKYEGLYANIVTTNSWFADIGNNGTTDLVYHYIIAPKCAGSRNGGHAWMATFDVKMNRNAGNIDADLMTETTNMFGGKTQVSYAPSSQFSNINLPFSFTLLKNNTKNPVVGPSGTTTYNYDGGLYDFTTREFKGFRHVQVTDPLGYVTQTYFHQDDPRLGKIEREETPITKTSYTYKEDNTAPYFTPPIQIDECIDAKCRRTAYEYDDYGNITKTSYYGDVETDADEKSILSEYAINSDLWLVGLLARQRAFANLDSSGPPLSETHYLYDNNADYATPATKGDLTKTRQYLDTKSAFVETSFSFDAYGNQVTRTDANGNTTQISYDPTYHSFPLTITNPKGHTQNFSYYLPSESKGLFGQLKSQTDPNNNTTNFEYDGFGRKTKVIGPYDAGSTYGSESYEYGLGGPAANYILTRSTEEYGTPSHLIKIDILDGFEKVIQTAKESEQEGVFSHTTTTYNPRLEVDKISLAYFKDGGLRTTYFEPDGSQNWMQNTYDALGRITQITKPDNTIITNSYSGWTTTTTDENSHQKTLVKDAYGRLINVKEKNGQEEYNTTYGYDGLDNLKLITDHLGNKYEFFYDSLKRRTRLVDPDLGAQSYEYDNNSNLTKTTDANDKIINFTYDSLNRLIQKEYSNLAVRINYNYDETSSTNAIGRRTSMQDLSGLSRWQYDKEGRTIKLEKTIDTATYCIDWLYDALDRIKAITFPNAKTVGFSYNNAGLSEGIDGFVQNTDYNAAFQPTQITFNNPIMTRFDYYPENLRLKSILTGSLQDLTYEYDGVGNITRIADRVPTHSSDKSYGYDALDRLISGDNNSYEYNPIGNLIKINAIPQAYSSSKAHAVTGDGQNSYSYDNSGNMTSGAGRVISYDTENRPLVITKDGITTQFSYDGDGKRTKKTVTAGSAKTTTIYIEGLYEKEIKQ